MTYALESSPLFYLPCDSQTNHAVSKTVLIIMTLLSFSLTERQNRLRQKCPHGERGNLIEGQDHHQWQARGLNPSRVTWKTRGAEIGQLLSCGTRIFVHPFPFLSCVAALLPTTRSCRRFRADIGSFADVGYGCLPQRTGNTASRTLVGFRKACEGREGTRVAVIFVRHVCKESGVGRSERRVRGVCGVLSLGR